MVIDRAGAASALDEIEQAERRTSEAMFYGRSGATLVLWGLLVAAGYVIGFLHPEQAPRVWPLVWLLGFAGTAILLRRQPGTKPRTGRSLQWRWMGAQLFLMAFGFIVLALLGPFDGRKLNAFWPLLFMLGYGLVGLWVGRFFIWCAAVVTLLTVAGYLWSGPWFPLWMAAANGGALVLGGLWLRRVGARP